MSCGREILVSMWVVYDHPKDFPDSYVIREWHLLDGSNVCVPSNFALSAATLDEIRAFVPPGSVRLDRHVDDDPAILETWL